MALPARRASDIAFWSPFRVFDDARNRELAEFGSRFNELVDAAFGGVEPARGWTPAVTIEETDEAYVLEAELPGIKREDIHVELDGGVVHLHGETTEVERTGEVRHQTRRTGTFDYRVSLPVEVDADQVSAGLTDGVLRLHLAKATPTKPRSIEISET
ncbi:Hsp20 family protein [Gordonia sp. HNM0687]|uniref:Hsp20 family protein n=1 Tax=Gordonia mangrovi TaxID=2665643 RepID=A0A6L7GYM6_9ACTN|nr:Hsp20/alpha crystallin family protein [Gordonia mangrovi]MXP23898.1 Hsp20 family protein [Gordonia mangrovi]UVF76450.1 Hsp20/alpha crystallin family protein [Gordonia mangrovi]